MSTIACRNGTRLLRLFLALGTVAAVGCQHTPMNLTPGPAPLRMPRPGEEPPSYEDSLTGGEVFTMYCSQCHNARALAERPFASYQNVVAHMRVRANFTGKEYEKLLEFFRRWHDIPSPDQPVSESPKRLIYSQPMPELRDQPAGSGMAAPVGPAQPPAGPLPPGAPTAAQPAPGAQPVPAAPGQPLPPAALPAVGG